MSAEHKVNKHQILHFLIYTLSKDKENKTKYKKRQKQLFPLVLPLRERGCPYCSNCHRSSQVNKQTNSNRVFKDNSGGSALSLNLWNVNLLSRRWPRAFCPLPGPHRGLWLHWNKWQRSGTSLWAGLHGGEEIGERDPLESIQAACQLRLLMPEPPAAGWVIAGQARADWCDGRLAACVSVTNTH